MRLRAFVKLTLKQLFRDFHTFVLVFAVFPLVLGALMAYFQRDLFTPVPDTPKIGIELKDEDNTAQSRAFKAFLESKNIKDIIQIKEKDAKIEVGILKGYEENLLKGKSDNIIIKAKEAGNKQEINAVSQLTDRYLEEISQGILLSSKLNDLQLSGQEKEKLKEKVNNDIEAAYNNKLFESVIVEGKKSLNSYEHYSITFLGFMFIMLMMSIAAGVFKEKEDGIFNRIISTSTTKVQYFNYSLVSCFIFAVVLNVIYVLAYRLSGLSFKGSLAILGCIIIVQSLLGTAAAGILVAFFNKKTSMIFMNVLLIFQTILGVLPLEKLGTDFVLAGFNNFSPDVLISKAYKSLMIYNDFKLIVPYLIGMFAVSTVFYLISLMKVNIKWGE